MRRLLRLALAAGATVWLHAVFLSHASRPAWFQAGLVGVVILGLLWWIVPARRPAARGPGDHRVSIGPVAFSAGLWGWLIARQISRRR